MIENERKFSWNVHSFYFWWFSKNRGKKVKISFFFQIIYFHLISMQNLCSKNISVWMNLKWKPRILFTSLHSRSRQKIQHPWILPVSCVNDFDGSFEPRNNLSLIERTQKMVSFSPFIHLMVHLMRFSFCDSLQPFRNAINQ